MTRLQSLQQSFQAKVERLSEVKLDAETIASIRLALNDPDSLAKFGSKAKNYFETVSGRWTLSIGISSLILAVCVPFQYETLRTNTALRNQYQQETNELPMLRSTLVAARSKQRALKAKQALSEQYLQNSLRILFLPEVIRSAASGQQIELLSFRPETSDGQNQNPQNPAPPPVGQNTQAVPSSPESPQPTGASMPRSKSFSRSGYSLQVRGDYLKVLNFLRELQNFSSYLTFKSTKFTAATSDSTASVSSPAASSTGEVVLDLVLEVPTQNYGGPNAQSGSINPPVAN